MTLITPEEFATMLDLDSLEERARKGHLLGPNVTLRLIATIRAVTARAEAAENERDNLREALRPFARASQACGTAGKDSQDTWEMPEAMAVDLGAFRRAARLLPAEPDQGC